MIQKLRTAVLVSGSGTNFDAIVQRAQAGQIDVDVCCVVSNKPGVGALERAERLGIPSLVIPHKEYPDRSSHEQAILDALGPYEPEMLALAGYMRVVTPTLLSAMSENRFGLPGVVNIHPADTRAYQGEHGYEFALGLLPEHPRRLDQTFITVHFVDAGVDTGPIIAQRPVPIFEIDSIDDLKRRGLQVEYGIYSQALQWIAQGRLKLEHGEITVQ